MSLKNKNCLLIHLAKRVIFSTAIIKNNYLINKKGPFLSSYSFKFFCSNTSVNNQWIHY